MSAVPGTAGGPAGGPPVELWWVRLPEPTGDRLARPDRAAIEGRLARRDVARQAARVAVARTLGYPDGAVELHRDPRGRPVIVLGGRAADRVSVSMSYAGDRMAVAVRDGGLVGIDVEHLGRDLDVAAIVSMFFTPAEARSLARAEPAEARRAFLEAWTWKEAVLKASGHGLRAPLPVQGSTGPFRCPSLATSLHPETDYLGCLVTDRPAAAPRWRQATLRNAPTPTLTPTLTEAPS